MTVRPRLDRIIPIAAAALLLSAAFAPGLAASPQETEQDAKAKARARETAVRITEEIQVVGKAPKEAPLATVTTVSTPTLELMKPRDLSEAVRFAPGLFVTVGNKEEYTLKLRGIDNKRIALLVDGVPVMEPYYGSFDLKTVSAGAVQSLQVTKGPSSVLYGPNTMGGIVNVITRRPSARPEMNLTGSWGGDTTRSAGVDGSWLPGRFGFAASAFWQDSGGWRYTDAASGARLERGNSDYERLNLNTKLFYVPSDRTEVMINVGRYTSSYGMPPDLFGKARYWRFKDWDRTSVNAGGFTGFGGTTVRFRAYYVNYYNVLDHYKDAPMTQRQFESTFDNFNAGAFGLVETPLSGWNTLKASGYVQGDKARQKDDAGLPWYDFHQTDLSVGLEDHVSLGERWKVIGGASFDTLYRNDGGTTSKLNPLLGLKYQPAEDVDVHVSYSSKSKFPSMRSLYSSSNGNPDLRSEFGRCVEVGVTSTRWAEVSGSVFFNELRDLIDTWRLPDGTRRFWNIGRARINGFELQARKDWRLVEVSAGFTYLDHRNLSDDRPLDVTPNREATFAVTVRPVTRLSVGLFGLVASSSSWYNTNTSSTLTVPAYSTVDAVVAYAAGKVAPFLRVTNLFDASYYTEPGFPWRGRYIEVGVKAGIF